MAFVASHYTDPLITNGFCVDLPETVDAIVREFPLPGDVKAERQRLQDYWFLHWVHGKLYYLRLKSGGPNVEGVLRNLRIRDYPWLLRARVEDAIGQGVSQYDPIRLRPFTFLAQKAELIETAAQSAGVSHPLLKGFTVTPRFILSPKVYEAADGAPRVGVFVTVGMHQDIDVPLAELEAAGFDMTGMYVIRRVPESGKRRLMGRISRIADGDAQLAEATDREAAPLYSLKLEASKENFARCLNALLGGSRYKALGQALDDAQAEYLLDRMGAHLAKTPLQLAQGIEARIGGRIILKNDDTARSIYHAPPVDYVFDRTGAKSAPFVWQGLAQFGPYDRATFANKSPRLLIVFPASTQGKVEAFLRAFRDGMGASYRNFAKGFRDLFGLVSVEFVMCPVAVAVADRTAAEGIYRTAIEARLSSSNDVHGGIIVLFDEHAF